MTVYSSLLFYSSLMAILSFVAGLPPFWILDKSQFALPYLVTLTSGLLLSTCLNIVLPEAISHLSEKQLSSPTLGPQILLGFILLYSIDVFSSLFSSYYKARLTDSVAIDTERAEFTFENGSPLSDDDYNINTLKSYLFSVVSNSTTLGLLLHCLTDGIILTTSILSENSHPEDSNTFAIILAIFLHKLPASFSLTSILLNQKLKNTVILFHLALFSISAPIGAWITLVISHVFNVAENPSSNAFIMLFSSGAFLYVSFHTFISCHSHESDAGKVVESHTFKANWTYLITMLGMLIPLIVAFTHADD